MASITPYQGGMPSLRTRFAPRQRGAGFFSTLKRYLLPIASTALPHVVGAVGDLIGGKGALETLKTRGRAAGADIMGKAADVMKEGDVSPAAAPIPKTIKRKAPQRRKSHSPKKAARKNHWS